MKVEVTILSVSALVAMATAGAVPAKIQTSHMIRDDCLEEYEICTMNGNFLRKCDFDLNKCFSTHHNVESPHHHSETHHYEEDGYGRHNDHHEYHDHYDQDEYQEYEEHHDHHDHHEHHEHHDDHQYDEHDGWQHAIAEASYIHHPSSAVVGQSSMTNRPYPSEHSRPRYYDGDDLYEDEDEIDFEEMSHFRKLLHHLKFLRRNRQYR